MVSQSSLRSQTGATLIIVLVVVLLLGIVSAIAIRGSRTALDMTTSSQVNKVMVESSDVPFARLELTNSIPLKTASKDTQLSEMMSGDGPLNYLRLGENMSKEYILCYQPMVSSKLYQGTGKHLILTQTDSKTYGTQGATTGYCTLDTATFTSGRQTVATQVTLTRPTVNNQFSADATDATKSVEDAATDDDVEVAPLSALNVGTDTKSAKMAESVYYRAYSTTVVPSMANSSSKDDIKNCLKQPIGGIAQKTWATSTKPEDLNNQRECLKRNDAPYNIQVQDFVYNVDAAS